MNNYLINYRKMVEHLVPPLLKKSKMLAWIRVFSSVFSNHNSRQGLEGIFRNDRITSREDKTLFGLNIIFQAPVSEERRRFILAEALDVNGANGIDDDLVTQLLEIGREVGQLPTLEVLETQYNISVVEEIVNRLSLADYDQVFGLDPDLNAAEEDEGLEFKIATYPAKVNDLSFERFRRKQLYNVLLTGQSVVLETHLNTLFGLYKYENGFYDLSRYNLTDGVENKTLDDQKIRIVNESSFEYTYFKNETGREDGVVLYCVEEPVESGTVLSPFIITGVIAGELERGIPQAIEFFAINEVDLSDFTLRVTAEFDTNFVTGEAVVDPEFSSIEYQFPTGVTLPAKSHFYISLDEDNGANFERFFDFAPDVSSSNFPPTSKFNLNRSAALELLENGAVVDIYGDPAERGDDHFWRYKQSWAYRKTDKNLLESEFLRFDWLYAGGAPFRESSELQTISVDNPESLLKNFGETKGVDNPFPAGRFGVLDLLNDRKDKYLGYKTETNQGAGYDFKVICPAFTDDNRPYEDTAKGAENFLNTMVAEINKFRLAGKFFIIEAEGSKGSAGADRLFEERFEETFE